jgi:hypothetical protein
MTLPQRWLRKFRSCELVGKVQRFALGPQCFALGPQCFALGPQCFALGQTCPGPIVQPAMEICQEIQNPGSGGINMDQVAHRLVDLALRFLRMAANP